MWTSRIVQVTLLLLTSLVSGAASISVTFSNAVKYQFDTDGNAIDLTSGKIDFLGGQYLWYGIPFGCGSAFCGITSYSSPDLNSWKFNGLLFDPTAANNAALCAQAGGCGRPHIVFNTKDSEYVLWVNAGTPGYAIFTSQSLISGYILNPNRALVGYQPAGPFQGGDFSVQVIDGTGYIAYSLIDFTTVGASIWPPFLQSIYIQQLTTDMKNTTWSVGHVISAASDLVDMEAESPDIFKRGDYFYVTASNTCGFCPGTLLILYRSKTIAGPWQRQIISGDTCGGQSTGVLTLPDPKGGQTSYLHVTDLFNTAPQLGARTAQHGHTLQQLKFEADGSVQDLNCSAQHTATLSFAQSNTSISISGATTTASDSSDSNHTSTPTTYTPHCNIPHEALYQTWTSSASGTLKSVNFKYCQKRTYRKLIYHCFPLLQ